MAKFYSLFVFKFVKSITMQKLMVVLCGIKVYQKIFKIKLDICFFINIMVSKFNTKGILNEH